MLCRVVELMQSSASKERLARSAAFAAVELAGAKKSAADGTFSFSALPREVLLGKEPDKSQSLQKGLFSPSWTGTLISAPRVSLTPRILRS